MQVLKVEITNMVAVCQEYLEPVDRDYARAIRVTVLSRIVAFQLRSSRISTRISKTGKTLA